MTEEKFIDILEEQIRRQEQKPAKPREGAINRIKPLAIKIKPNLTKQEATTVPKLLRDCAPNTKFVIEQVVHRSKQTNARPEHIQKFGSGFIVIEPKSSRRVYVRYELVEKA